MHQETHPDIRFSTDGKMDRKMKHEIWCYWVEGNILVLLSVPHAA